MELPVFIGKLTGSLIGGIPFSDMLDGKASNPLSRLGDGLGVALIGIPIGLIIIRYLWRRSFEWMRLRFRADLVLYGLLGGAALTFVAVGLASLFGDVQIARNRSDLSSMGLMQVLLGSFLTMAFAGFVEECTFRGMVVREWAVRWGWVTATILGGLYFGAMHLSGGLGEMGVFGAVQILIAAIGVTALFVALYVRSGSLWLPIGFHVGWNFSLASILGTTMSGTHSAYSLLQVSLSGPDLVTGGKFGIEASAITVVVYLLAAAAVLYAFRGRANLLSPSPESHAGQPGEQA